MLLAQEVKNLNDTMISAFVLEEYIAYTVKYIVLHECIQMDNHHFCGNVGLFICLFVFLVGLMKLQQIVFLSLMPCLCFMLPIEL